MRLSAVATLASLALATGLGDARAMDASLHAEYLAFAAPVSAWTTDRVRPEEVSGLDIVEMRDLGRVPVVDLTERPDDLWERIRNGFAIPNLDGPLVVERQAWYAQRPAQLKIMVERSRRYLYYIVEELERRGMPTELALLPMVESAYNPMAYSPAHASGLWQFIPSTGKTYKLEQNWWYDARRDIIASTHAALDYLQFLYEMHGDWHLALASYNWGENAVARAIEKNRKAGLPTDYASLSMPDETRYYVPRLQALENLVANPVAAGIDLDPIPNRPYFVTVTLTRDIDLRVAAKLAEMQVEELVRLNPGHNRPVIETSVAPTLVLPADRAERFARNLADHDKPLSSWTTYAAKSGDRVERVAAAHGMTLDRFLAVNGLTRNARLSPGQPLLVPVKGAGAEPLPASALPPTARAPAAATPRPAKPVASATGAKKPVKSAKASPPAAKRVAKAPARPAAKPADPSRSAPAVKVATR
ncbi:MAG: transglycosylase SLT domain-containing protein [Burkholderiales bacterium]|nr:transglycosylase SLT domain-containing protein [Burkholderiales bacterium]